MSFQWTFIAAYLYFEIAIVTILILPIFSPRRWYQFFQSRLFYNFQKHAAVYFYVLLGILTLFLMDAVREMRKYSHSHEGSNIHFASEMKGNVKLFRAQRNFYITGFAIFLAFVIRRLVTMLITQHELNVKASRVIKESENNVTHAKNNIPANALQSSEIRSLCEIADHLEKAQNELKEQKCKTKEFEEAANLWRARYDEVAKSHGKGDLSSSLN